MKPTITTATAVGCKLGKSNGVLDGTIDVNAVINVTGGNFRELNFDSGYFGGVIHNERERVFNNIHLQGETIPSTVQAREYVEVQYTAMNGLPSVIDSQDGLSVTIDMTGVTCK